MSEDCRRRVKRHECGILLAVQEMGHGDCGQFVGGPATVRNRSRGSANSGKTGTKFQLSSFIPTERLC